MCRQFDSSQHHRNPLKQSGFLFLFSLLFSLFAKHTLIQEPKHPKRHLVVEDIFCVVLDHIAVFDIFNLFLSLFPATHLKGLAVNLKIRDR